MTRPSAPSERSTGHGTSPSRHWSSRCYMLPTKRQITSPLGHKPFNKSRQGRCLISVEWNKGNVAVPRHGDSGKRRQQTSRRQVGLEDRQWPYAKPETIHDGLERDEEMIKHTSPLFGHHKQASMVEPIGPIARPRLRRK